MEVLGAGLSGTVSSFVRWPPVETPSMTEIAVVIRQDEFAGSTVLVVGGSRGLGAVTAKMLASGGARVIITYARGRADAERLSDEVNTACGEDVCHSLQLDARADIASQLAALSENVTHLYYFATPQIYRQKSEVYVASIYRDLHRIYIDAFAETCRFLLSRGMSSELSVFYPSSVFAEERPVGMTEYSMAKLAAETLCADLARDTPGLRILVHRLPRVLTDQTASVTPTEIANPMEIMLPIVRNVQA